MSLRTQQRMTSVSPRPTIEYYVQQICSTSRCSMLLVHSRAHANRKRGRYHQRVDARIRLAAQAPAHTAKYTAQLLPRDTSACSWPVADILRRSAVQNALEDLLLVLLLILVPLHPNYYMLFGCTFCYIPQLLG